MASAVTHPTSPSDKSLTGSLMSESDNSNNSSSNSYSIREDKWPDLVVSRPRKLDPWWLPRRKFTIFRFSLNRLFLFLYF